MAICSGVDYPHYAEQISPKTKNPERAVTVFINKVNYKSGDERREGPSEIFSEIFSEGSRVWERGETRDRH